MNNLMTPENIQRYGNAQDSGEPSEISSDDELCCENSDTEIWRETQGDYYAPSIHVTKDGMIAVNVGGNVFVRDVREWHKLANKESI